MNLTNSAQAQEHETTYLDMSNLEGLVILKELSADPQFAPLIRCEMEYFAKHGMPHPCDQMDSLIGFPTDGITNQSPPNIKSFSWESYVAKISQRYPYVTNAIVLLQRERGVPDDVLAAAKNEGYDRILTQAVDVYVAEHIPPELKKLRHQLNDLRYELKASRFDQLRPVEFKVGGLSEVSFDCCHIPFGSGSQPPMLPLVALTPRQAVAAHLDPAIISVLSTNSSTDAATLLTQLLEIQQNQTALYAQAFENDPTLPLAVEYEQATRKWLATRTNEYANLQTFLSATSASQASVIASCYHDLTVVLTPILLEQLLNNSNCSSLVLLSLQIQMSNNVAPAENDLWIADALLGLTNAFSAATGPLSVPWPGVVQSALALRVPLAVAKIQEMTNTYSISPSVLAAVELLRQTTILGDMAQNYSETHTPGEILRNWKIAGPMMRKASWLSGLQ